MRLYSASTEQFLTDNVKNQIAEKLKLSFFNEFRFNPSPTEVSSWRNSLRAISHTFQYADLMDHGVIIEYQLPLTSKRLDVVITGKDKYKKDNAVIIELKQWERCGETSGPNEVLTFIGGSEREVLHPSVQVGQYQQYLLDTHTAFYESPNPIVLHACAYLHNYMTNSEGALFSRKFEKTLTKYPSFTGNDVDQLSDYLTTKLENGDGLTVLRRVEESEFRPSKKLMDHVGNVIKGNSEYILLDEQLVVYDKVFTCAKQGFHDKRKTVIIIKGGPGTGKSVIALNLMADLLLNRYNTHYATGSRAFTQTLRSIIGSRGAIQFKYFNSYTNAQNNELDVLIADEAHRIRRTSQSRYTPKALETSIHQIEELLHASKVSVFFIDDHQVVRPGEIGSVAYIREFADKNNSEVLEYELEAQFRCRGSDAFVSWVNNTLGIRKTANVIWDETDLFDFRVVASPHELEKAIVQRSEEGHTGRLTAGFCWPWSKPKLDGTLKNDVVIGDYLRPWNARPEATKLAANIPKATLWAHDPNGMNQIGCIYTAQGFEFDYVGIIFGNDLTYNFDLQRWEGHKKNSHDVVVKRSGEKFTDLVKNTYRVLLSRGMMGCYVYFMDKDTERFFKSRMEPPPRQ